MSNGTEGNDLAFPNQGQHEDYKEATGLTKREYYAGLAMQGMIASYAHPNAFASVVSAYPETANEAVKHADELIKALNKTVLIK